MMYHAGCEHNILSQISAMCFISKNKVKAKALVPDHIWAKLGIDIIPSAESSAAREVGFRLSQHSEKRSEVWEANVPTGL